MPIVNVPGIGQVNFPDSMSHEDIVNAIQTKILPQAGKSQDVTPTDQDSPFLGSLKAGTERAKGEAALLAGKLGLMDTGEAEKYRAAREKEAEQIYAPTEKGWSEAPLTKLKELAGSSLPYTAAPIVAAGATALAPEPR